MKNETGNLKDMFTSKERIQGLLDMIDIEFNLGQTYYEMQEFEKAIEYYNGCLNILYDNFDIKDDQELNIEDKVKRIKNKIALSYINIGDGYFIRQDNENAINFYKQSMIIDPNHYLVFLKLGVCFSHLDSTSDSAMFI